MSLDLELDSILEWISWEMNSSSVEVPSLGGMVSAVIPSHSSVVGVSVALSSEASSTWVSDASSGASEE